MKISQLILESKESKIKVTSSNNRVYNVPISELTKTGSKIGRAVAVGRAVGAAVGGGAAALGIKKGLDAYKNRHSLAGQTKKFMDKNGKKVAAGTLAALGAGIGVKALLKHLRKKKVQE